MRRPAQAPAPSPARRAVRDQAPIGLLALAFVFSGAAGLVYESVWSRYLGLFVGHGAYAQIIVLVIFMAGMAGGALGVGRRSDRLRDPLRLYVLVEIAVALLGLTFHPAFVALTGFAYQAWFPALGEGPALPVVKWALAGLMILPQSVLLGATFPLMSAGVVRRRPTAPGAVIALLYFTNSLGAAAGVLAAGFWLTPAGGLPGTLAAAATLNLLAAALVALVARRGVAAGAAPASAPARPWAPPPSGGEAVPTRLARLMIAASFGTAVASFVYEIAWVRMLSLVLGSATHSFELMLSAFILGLALGAGWVQRRADRLADPLRTLAATQWVMGALALMTLPLYAASFHWMVPLVRQLQGTPNGYEIFSLARYGICLAVMLPATFCAGITLPLLTRILMARGGEGAIGAIYGANTLGSIMGAALAGLVLLPWLGLERLLAAGALLDIAIGVALLRSGGGRPREALVAAAAGLVLVIGLPAVMPLDPLTLVSGVYRTAQILTPRESRVIFYHDGRTATVSVRRQPNGDLTLSTNGKPDASVTANWLARDARRPRAPMNDDESTQLLLGVAALAYQPRAASAAVIGLGSGMTSHVLLGSRTLSRVLTIEIEPDMIRAARLFQPANRRVFEDPRSGLVVDDARSYFAASRERFDLIVSEPSNPWVSGVSGLFTDEFYRRVRGALTDHGVLGQWLHLYSLDDDLALSVLAALARNFRDFRVLMVSSTDCLIVATNRPGGLEPDWSVIHEPGIAADLSPTHPFTPAVLQALYVTDRAALEPLLARVRANSDFQPILDMGAEEARFRNRNAEGFLALHADRIGLAGLRAPRVEPPADPRVPVPLVLRVGGLARVAVLRAALGGTPPPTDDRPRDRARLIEALERQRRVRAPLATHRPPGDWRRWLTDAVVGENDLHRGASGYADEGYFHMLRQSLSVAHGPAPAARVIEWLHALERRDWAGGAALTDSILADVAAGEAWIPPALFADGGIAAKIAVGDRAGARAVFDAAGLARMGTRDLRVRLAEAWVTGPP